MIAGTMSFKDQCLYWHNYFRTLHQVNTRDSLVGTKKLLNFSCEGVEGEKRTLKWHINDLLLHCFIANKIMKKTSVS